MKKRLLLLVCLCTGITWTALADDVIRQRIEIKDSVDGLYYLANSDSTAIVTYGTEKYTGEKEIKSEVSLWTQQVAHVNGGNRKIYKTYKVVAVGDSAFLNCSGLTSVTIPESVTSIGVRSFFCCTSLSSVIIPNSVTDIEYGCFYGCTELTSVTIGGSLTAINDYAFFDCQSLSSVSIPGSVTSIGYRAFGFCKSLKSINIPSSVTRIGEGAFSNSGIESIVLPNSITKIEQSTFNSCSSLTSITIPESVDSIEYRAFYGCSSLNGTDLSSVTYFGEEAFMKSRGSVYLGDNVKSLSKNVFDDYTTIYVSKGSYTLLMLWLPLYSSRGYYILDKETGDKFIKPELHANTTQTTLRLSIYYKYLYDDYYVFFLNGKQLDGNETIKGLTPGEAYSYTAYIYKSVDDKTIAVPLYCTGNIDGMMQRTNAVTTASSISVAGNYYHGDAEVVSQVIRVDGKIYEGSTAFVTGLEPNSRHTVRYDLTISNGKLYTTSETVTTQQLTLTTQPPKVVTEGNVIVQATSNLDDAEINVGFEWRRTDWDEDFASNSGKAYLYEGAMEGYIRNLNTNFLFRYRPYYQSSGGTMYYGEWTGIDPTNTSYFEPTVHTYADFSVDGNSATIKGYVQRGTESLSTRGFVYWKTSAASSSQASRAPSIPAGAQTVTVAMNGNDPVLESTLTELDYGTKYTYVAFATTSENETFYGAERTFTTGEAPTPPQDVTRNGVVDTQDVLQIYEYMRTPTGADSPVEDVNADGNVDTQDVLDVYDYIRGK